MDRHLEQTLALAAIAQSAFMVKQLAQHGLAAQEKFNTAVDSLFVTSPKTTVEVFGSISKLNQGLQIMQEILEGNSAVFSSDQILKYLMGLLYLQSRLAKRRDLLQGISEGLERIGSRYPPEARGENQELVKELAGLYQETISTLPFRIQVRGDMQRLQNDYIAARIRVLLFAGVRAAVLWEQRGGRRWHLLFRRKRISRDVNRLLHGLV